MTEEQMTPEDSARSILERLRDGGLWQPAGLGLSYVKDGEKTVRLVEQENNPTSAQARINMNRLLKSIGWIVQEEDVRLVDVDHLSPQERHMQEMMMRQEAAQSWSCSCGTPFSAFPLEEGAWVFDGQEEMLMPDGEREMVEQWSVHVTCPVCNLTTNMEPYDYGLVAGDESLLTYRTGKIEYHALDRWEIINRMDSKAGEVLVLGTFCPFHGDMLPPHVRGSVVTFNMYSEEE